MVTFVRLHADKEHSAQTGSSSAHGKEKPDAKPVPSPYPDPYQCHSYIRRRRPYPRPRRRRRHGKMRVTPGLLALLCSASVHHCPPSLLCTVFPGSWKSECAPRGGEGDPLTCWTSASAVGRRIGDADSKDQDDAVQLSSRAPARRRVCIVNKHTRAGAAFTRALNYSARRRPGTYLPTFSSGNSSKRRNRGVWEGLHLIFPPPPTY